MRHKQLLAIALSIMCLALFALLGSNNRPLLAQSGPETYDVIPLADRNLLQVSGFVTMLRVHDVGTGYGPGDDFLDGEVVIRLDSQEGKSFGFQLRNDDNQPAREGMLGLLRDAFNNDWIVTINYWLEPGKTNGEIIRLWLTKPVIL